MESLFEYLHRTGALERNDPDFLQSAKRTYRKEYQRQKQRDYREQKHRIEILLLSKEKKILQKAAQKRGMKLSPFIKEAALGYLDFHFILPESSRVQSCELQLRGISNNINQLHRYIHQQKQIDSKDLYQLKEQVSKVEDIVTQTLRQPLTLQEYLATLLRENPEFLPELQKILQNHISNVH